MIELPFIFEVTAGHRPRGYYYKLDSTAEGPFATHASAQTALNRAIAANKEHQDEIKRIVEEEQEVKALLSPPPDPPRELVRRAVRSDKSSKSSKSSKSRGGK
jgi:hypothetical protein